MSWKTLRQTRRRKLFITGNKLNVLKWVRLSSNAMCLRGAPFCWKQKSRRDREMPNKIPQVPQTEPPKKPSCCFVVLSCYHRNPGSTKERIIGQYDSCYCLWQCFNKTRLTGWPEFAAAEVVVREDLVAQRAAACPQEAALNSQSAAPIRRCGEPEST